MTPEELSRLHHISFPGERGWSAAEFQDLCQTKGVALISEPSGFLLGRHIAGESEILTLCTAPAARRRGIAARCLSRFFQDANQNASTRIFLEVAADNQSAIALYHSNGFTQSGVRKAYYPRKSGEFSDALVLSRTLP